MLLLSVIVFFSMLELLMLRQIVNGKQNLLRVSVIGTFGVDFLSLGVLN